jgi:c-di-GMP-binding flagellar brake protein YcgR
MVTTKDNRVTGERFKFEIYCIIEDFNDEAIEIKNISSGGMFLMTEKPLPSNLELNFKILDKDQNELYEGVGIIKWGTIIKNPNTNVVSRGCGIQFFQIAPVNQKEEFIDYLRNVYYKLHGKEYDK